MKPVFVTNIETGGAQPPTPESNAAPIKNNFTEKDALVMPALDFSKPAQPTRNRVEDRQANPAFGAGPDEEPVPPSALMMPPMWDERDED